MLTITQDRQTTLCTLPWLTSLRCHPKLHDNLKLGQDKVVAYGLCGSPLESKHIAVYRCECHQINRAFLGVPARLCAGRG